MSNTITAYFKGRVGVAESVYQNDYGIVMEFDSIVLPTHFDCYFSRLNQEEALPGLGADNRVTIPNSILANPGNVTIHIPLHTGNYDSEVEYIIYFKVIGRARPVDDGTPIQMTAIEQALALLQNPIDNIDQIVEEALSYTSTTFAAFRAEMEEFEDDIESVHSSFETEIRTAQSSYEASVNADIASLESDFDNLEAQFNNAIAAVTTETEVTNIRVGADNYTYSTAGEAVRTQISELMGYYNINDYEFEYGGIYNGIETPDTNRIRSVDMIRVYKGMHIKFVGIYNGLWVGSYNLDGTWRANGSWTKDFTVAQDGYVRIVLCKQYNAEIATGDFATLQAATKVIYNFVKMYNTLLEDIDAGGASIAALNARISDVSDKAGVSLTFKYTQQTETGYAIKNNVAIGATVNLTPVAVESMASIVIKHIPKGMKFRVFGTSTYYYLCYSWLDKDAKMLEKPEAWTPSYESGIVVTAPVDDCMLVCSSTASYTYGFYVESLCSVVNLYNSLANSDALVEPLVEQKKNVKNNLLGSATADFVFFSDIHDGSTNFNRIIDYAEDNSVDAILNGGDTILKYLNDAEHPMTWYTDGITASSVDILSAVGNHDVWDGAYWTKADAVDVYNAFIAPIVAKYSDIVQPSGASTNGLCYYYKDYGAVRVVVLNAMAGDSSVNFWDTTQANWLDSVLDDAITNSKHVLIVNHAPFQKTIAVRDERLHWNSYIDYTTLLTYDGIHTTPDAVQLVKDFIDDGGMFVGWLTGHLHFDNVITETGFDKQIMFNIATANNAIHTDGVSYTDATSQYYDCFNHIAVDTAKGLVKMIRIGWNTDYALKIREVISYDYVHGRLLTDN